jgi:hypothetical protein
MQGLGSLPEASELGTIRSQDGWSYQITPEDMLWLARSLAYEGGDMDMTAWTYAQRMAARGRGMTLAAMVRGHSQPVNPIWESLTSGSPARGCVRNPERCTPDQIARRLEARTAPWDSLSSRVKVLAWAQARTPNTAPRSTDFADAHVSGNFLRQYPQSSIVARVPSGRSEQWYLTEGRDSSPRASKDWPADFVTVEHEGRVAGPESLTRRTIQSIGATRPASIVTGAAILGGGAAFAWWAYTKRKSVKRNRRSSRRTRPNTRGRGASVHARLTKELAKAESPPKRHGRPGIHYAWFNAANLDRAIEEKRRFAQQWRRAALALGPNVEERTAHNKNAVAFRVFSVDGVDRLAVAPTKGSNYSYRMVKLDGQSFDQYFKR